MAKVSSKREDETVKQFAERSTVETMQKNLIMCNHAAFRERAATANTKSECTDYDIKLGDIITVEGYYKRRTFWQWLARRPRELKQFVVGTDFIAV